MTSHSVALMMLGMAIGGSLATTVLCLCASARCQDCQFHYGPEWPENDLPSDDDQPPVYASPASGTERLGSSAQAADPTTTPEPVVGCAQVGDGSRESRAGLGGFTSILSEFWSRRESMRHSSPWRPCTWCRTLGTDSTLDFKTGMCQSCLEKRGGK